jgi:predicted small lipoprotein YifL
MSMKISLSAAAVVAALSAAAIVGCGGGGGAIAPPAGTNANTDARKLYLTPTPTPTPIQLVIRGTIGTQAAWNDGDDKIGGKGQVVDGQKCVHALSDKFHHHVHVSLFVNGVQLWFPKGAGTNKPIYSKDGFIYKAKCWYYTHTHDRTGIVHMEGPDARTFTLKNIFDLMGQPLSTTVVGPYSGNVGVYIDGVLQPGMDPNTIQFTPHMLITLVIGTPPSWIPAYIFPPDYN